MDKLIPDIAYRYRPTEDYLYSGEKTGIKRSIYYKTQFTVFEKAAILEFKNYVKDKLPCKTVPEFFGDEEVLRILIRFKFNNKRAVDGLIGEIEWRTSMLPNSYHSLGLQVQPMVNSGIIYISGRDNRYRPLIIILSEKLSQLKNQIEKISYLLIFFIEFIRSELSIPGKVENFILLVDMAGRTIKDSPIKELKKLYEIIQTHYPDYLSLNYIINSAGKGMFGSMFSNFMDAEITRKTLWDKSNGSDYLSIHFNPGQLEKKYGGNLENYSEFWPVVMPPGPYAASGETEDAFLLPEEPSESDFNDISEKMSLSLPFTREENILSDVSSIKFDTNSYNVDVDIPASIEDPELQNLSHGEKGKKENSEVEDDSEDQGKKCCNRIKCMVV